LSIKISLESARVNAKLTQKEAAEKLGVTQQTIYTWEKEPNKIPIGKAYKLAVTYGLPLDAIDFLCN